MKVIGISFVILVVLISGCVHISNKSVGSSVYVDPPSQPLPGCGIDSKELRGAADKMARSIFTSPQIIKSGTTPRIVIDSKYFRNDSSQIIDKAMFTDYLRVELQRAAEDRFEIVGRNYFRMVEEERAAEKEGKVTAGIFNNTSKMLGWDYRMGGAIRSISKVVPRTGQRSSYYLITFELIERGSGKVVWSDRYEFKKISNTQSIYR
ncbi:MAG: penicillin-binding protein activator LpoB [Planctomycetes bacterium]|nr:penicillin-binding protein activator LpoB [Planctomycetota bacterium]